MSQTVSSFPPSRVDIDRSLMAERCKRSLYQFVKHFWPVIEEGTEFIDSWHVAAICDHLQAVSEGHINNLLINIPPGFAKSMICSAFWPAWGWIRRPYLRYLFGSYEEGLTYRDSCRHRTLVKSKMFRDMFDPGWDIAKNVDAKGYFENTATGFRKTFYMGSQVKTGWRAHYVMVDDPMSAEKRHDALAKKEVIDTWDTVLWSRPNRNNEHAFIVVMQRLSEDDLCGHIISTYGDRYVKLILMNEFEHKRKCITYINGVKFFEDPRTQEGELLCPRLMSAEMTAQAKVIMGHVDYSAQYQHNPIPSSGNRFEVSKFQYWNYSSPPYLINLVSRDGTTKNIRLDRLQRFVAIDVAASEKTVADYTVMGMFAMTDVKELILLHLIRIQKKEYEVVNTASELFGMKSWGQNPPYMIAVEDNGVGLPIAQAMQTVGLPVKFIHVNKEFVSRTATAIVRIEGGQIFFPDLSIAPWMHDFIHEMSAFPNGKNDDQVSMISIAANVVYEIAAGSPRDAKPVPKDRVDPMTRMPSIPNPGRPTYGNNPDMGRSRLR